MQLVYFPLRARAEPLRMLFRYSKVPYTDEMVQWKDWPTLKPTLPNKMLPQLKLEDGSLLPETMDIALHVATLAKQYGYAEPLTPSTPEHAASAEHCWRETSKTSIHYLKLDDLWADTTPWEARVGACNPLLNMLPEEDALKLIPTYLEGATSWMRNLESRIHEGGPFFGGASPHHGDFNTFHMVDQITTLDGGAALQQCGLPVQIWFASVASLPAVALYLNERPKAGTGLLGKPGSLIHERSEPHVRL